MNIKLSLDFKKYKKKPSAAETAKISGRLGKYIKEISTEKFAESVVLPNSQTFSPAVFTHGKRSNDSWQSQQIFALDIDDGITVPALLLKCRQLAIEPNFIYTTFSHTEDNPKFRVVFVMDEVIEDIRVRNFIQKSLMKVFPVDSATKDPSRLYYGGKEIVYSNYNSVTSVLDVYHAACIVIKSGSNPTRGIKSYCQVVGVDILNGNPKISIFNGNKDIPTTDNNVFIGMTKKRTSPNINNRKCTDFSHLSYAIYFTRSNTNDFCREINNSFEHTFDVQHYSKDKKLIRDYDFDQLYQCCQLYRESLNGLYWLYHNEMLGLMTNLLQIRGGISKIRIILDSRVEYQEKMKSWNVMKNQILKADYAPMRCDNYCPFRDRCIHNVNMIEQGKLIKGRIQTIGKRTVKSLQEARVELTATFKEVMNKPGKGIYIIKAPLGIGKTEEYLKACKDHNITIALPTHHLIEEVESRLQAVGVSHYFKIPRLPNIGDNDYQRLRRLYDIGAYRGANSYLNKLAADNEEVGQYLKEIKSARKIRNQTLITTHKRLLFDKDLNDTVIVDEDIILKGLFEISEFSLLDFLILNEMLQSKLKLSESRQVLESVLKIINDCPEGLIQKTPDYFMPYANEIEEIIASESKISTDILSFLSSSHYVKLRDKRGKAVIKFISRRNLPNKKVILFSATINENIAKMIFGNDIYFYDIGEVEHKGELLQYPAKSFTKHNINKDSDGMYNLAINLREITNPGSKVISFDGYFTNISEEGLNFWNSEGIDNLKGQNLTIIGTPHVDPYCYLLFANALGHSVQLEGSKINYHAVSNGNYRFYFYTYGSDDLLREIQFYIVESALMQVVGRARTITEPCRVLILSNYPVSGAEFIPLTQREVKEFMASSVC